MLQSAVWEPEYLEDVALRRLVLDLYDSEHVALRRYVTFLGIDPETGRELVQDAFLKLHQHLLENGDRTNLRAWLYRVAHNLVRNAQTAHRSLKTDYLPDVSVTSDVPSGDDSAETRLLDAERQRQFQAALSHLSSAQRECLVLRSRGLKYREIGQILKISTSTVGENIQRGMDQLRVLIGS